MDETLKMTIERKYRDFVNLGNTLNKLETYRSFLGVKEDDDDDDDCNSGFDKFLFGEVQTQLVISYHNLRMEIENLLNEYGKPIVMDLSLGRVNYFNTAVFSNNCAILIPDKYRGLKKIQENQAMTTTMTNTKLIRGYDRHLEKMKKHIEDYIEKEFTYEDDSKEE